MADSEELEPKNPADKTELTTETPEEVQPKNTSDVADAEDSKTARAVDDIMKTDSDEVLKAQDEAAEKAVVMKSSKWENFRNGWVNYWASPKKRWLTIAGLVVVLGVLFGVPYTRYNILGVALKGTATVQVVDSKTGAPVSGAIVELSGKKAETQANGKVQLKVNAGTGNLKVSKKYYTGYSGSKLVALGSQTFKTTVVATGRQVTVKLVNKVTNKPISGATLTAGGANAKTDAKGMANLVIPSGADTQSASVTANGYNAIKVTITAGDNIAKNTFSVSPAGKLYFLSNQSGTLDVVKTNLDGSDRKTVLAGTGNEDKNGTSLLASRDWKYLALLSRRSGDKASIYLIDTTNGDKLSTIDEGNVTFELKGWSGDYFVYVVNRNDGSTAQVGRYALKSFDPTSGKTALLDQTTAKSFPLVAGVTAGGYIQQDLGEVYLLGNHVVYTKNWAGHGSTNTDEAGATTEYRSYLNGKSAELRTIGADGSGGKTIKTFAPSAIIHEQEIFTNPIRIVVSTRLYEPRGLYVEFKWGATTRYYEYEDGNIEEINGLTSEKFYNTFYPTHLLSPSGSKYLWAEVRDGKNTLLTGDEDVKSQKQVASLNEYSPYGWYTDDYLLVSKNGSELYIISKDGGKPQKITDYYRPGLDYSGYGGGYGGI